MADTTHTFQVTHPDLGTITLPAPDRYAAIVAAAGEWGWRWTKIAKDCTVTDLGATKLYLCRYCGAKLDQPGLCHKCKADRRDVERTVAAYERQQRRERM